MLATCTYQRLRVNDTDIWFLSALPRKVKQSVAWSDHPSVFFLVHFYVIFWTDWSLNLRFCICMDHDLDDLGNEGQGHRSEFGLSIDWQPYSHSLVLSCLKPSSLWSLVALWTARLYLSRSCTLDITSLIDIPVQSPMLSLHDILGSSMTLLSRCQLHAIAARCAAWRCQDQWQWWSPVRVGVVTRCRIRSDIDPRSRTFFLVLKAANARLCCVYVLLINEFATVTAGSYMLHTRTHNTTVLQLFGFCPGQAGWAGTRRNITR